MPNLDKLRRPNDRSSTETIAITLLCGAGLFLGACGANLERTQSAASPADSAESEPIGVVPADEPAAKAAADDDVQPELDQPDDVVADIAETIEEQPAIAEALDAVDPLDEKATASEVRELRDERDDAGPVPDKERRNESGELDRLDEAAALACADVERALTAMDEGSTAAAAEATGTAAIRAQESKVAGIAAWSEPLSEVDEDDDVAVLLGFLSICTRGGYEL